MTRILVCGGRDYDDYAHVRAVLDQFCDEHGLADNEYHMPNSVVIIHGGAKGADHCADQWAVVNWVPTEAYEADWSTHRRAAGPLRNQRMLDEGKPDVVIAFPGGRGTADMVRRAKDAGVEVIEVPHEDAGDAQTPPQTHKQERRKAVI